MKTILCYGDSNTHGTAPLPAPGVDLRHPPGDRWPDVLAAELGAEAEWVEVHPILREGFCVAAPRGLIDRVAGDFRAPHRHHAFT